MPVRFSRWSIASNKNSQDDPWSPVERTSSFSGGGPSPTPQPLTSAAFRQQMDKGRSFTASAPPGARPPTDRRKSAPDRSVHDDDDDDDDDDSGGGGGGDHGESRRDTLCTKHNVHAGLHTQHGDPW